METKRNQAFQDLTSMIGALGNQDDLLDELGQLRIVEPAAPLSKTRAPKASPGSKSPTLSASPAKQPTNATHSAADTPENSRDTRCLPNIVGGVTPRLKG